MAKLTHDEQKLVDLFYSENINGYDWDFYDRVDDYCSECECEVEIDGYIFEADAQYSCGDYEVKRLNVTTPDGKKMCLIDEY